MNVDPLKAEDIAIVQNEWIKDAQATLIGQPDYVKYQKPLGVVINGELYYGKGGWIFPIWLKLYKAYFVS